MCLASKSVSSLRYNEQPVVAKAVELGDLLELRHLTHVGRGVDSIVPAFMLDECTVGCIPTGAHIEAEWPGSFEPWNRARSVGRFQENTTGFRHMFPGVPGTIGDFIIFGHSATHIQCRGLETAIERLVDLPPGIRAVVAALPHPFLQIKLSAGEIVRARQALHERASLPRRIRPRQPKQSVAA